jgi:hypothetical protein
MKCPNPDKLLHYQKSGSLDPELEDHLEKCPDCRTDLFIIRELPFAVRPQVEVPEWLIDRVVAEFPPAETSSDLPETPPARVLVRAILGVTTALAGFVATGTLGLGSSMNPLLLSLVGGVGAVLVQSLGPWEASR